MPRVECPYTEHFTRCGKKAPLFWLYCKTAFNSAEHRLLLPSLLLHNLRTKQLLLREIRHSAVFEMIKNEGKKIFLLSFDRDFFSLLVEGSFG